MATRSTVGIEKKGKFFAIYVHSDGHPSFMLKNLPNKTQNVLNLIFSGDGSIIDNGKVVKNTKSYDDKPSVYHSKYSWLSDMKKMGCEYYYFWFKACNQWEYGCM